MLYKVLKWIGFYTDLLFGPGLPSTLRNVAPVAFAMVMMIIGYVWHVPGTRHPQDYHDYSFQTLNYSDIIWLYLRDNLAHQPRPYLDYKLEYPALLGGLSYVLSFAP